ncbi:MAG TPA: carboxypeptidase regulatory-like domain-containing protein, partial [Thermoanaerobaculia bacterium]|nr:carboxypeptidase regulatory-like domain-containing protein [Thermoanaerobaculia bacterium]
MRFTRHPLLLVSLVTLLCASALLAQTAGTTSALSGTVTSGGSALPGVTVTVTSPSLQGTRTSVTGEGGGFTFPSLPPGDYTVKYSLEGMQPVTRKVKLSLAQPAHADADLKVGAVEEAITVTANAPAVLETTQVGTNFNQSQVDKLPVARNIRQTVLLAPGVNPNGVNNQITINGAPSVENVFMVNGVVVNENLRGQPHNLFIEDAIQETAVLTAGISAEYGRFTGGVVSTITKSGSNDFNGSIRDSMNNAAWTDDIKDTAITFVPPDRTNHIYEATFGGRILRDRLWFFAAGRKAKTAVGQSTVRTNLSFTNSFDEKRYEGKLTAQITSKHSLVGSYLDLTNLETNNFSQTIYDFDSIVPSRELPNRLQSVSYNGVLTNNLLIEGQWSEKTFAFINSGGRNTDPLTGTWVQDSVTGSFAFAPVFCGVCSNENRDSSSVGGKGSYFLSTRSLGNHTIAFGGDHFWETRVANNYQSASQFQITARVAQVTGEPTKVVPVFNSATQLTWRPIFVLTPGTDLSSDSVFINDRWDLNSRFSFNIGVRYDVNDAKDADGNQVSDDSNFSPRLGAMFDLRGDGKHRITASIARYVAKITDGSNVTSTAQAAGNPAQFTWAYTGPAINAINAQGFTTGPVTSQQDAFKAIFAWFAANCDGNNKCGTANTNFIASAYPGYSAAFPESLASPSADEITVGYGVQISRNAFARMDVLHREWSNFYAGLLNSPSQRLVPPNGI